MNKKRNDISKAEQHANNIITQAELRKQQYLKEANDKGIKEVQKVEEKLKENYALKTYDLTEVKNNLEDGKVNNIEEVKRQYE